MDVLLKTVNGIEMHVHLAFPNNIIVLMFLFCNNIFKLYFWRLQLIFTLVALNLWLTELIVAYMSFVYNVHW